MSSSVPRPDPVRAFAGRDSLRRVTIEPAGVQPLLLLLLVRAACGVCCCCWWRCVGGRPLARGERPKLPTIHVLVDEQISGQGERFVDTFLGVTSPKRRFQ